MSVGVSPRGPLSTPTLVANAALSLLNLACYLLDRQLAAHASISSIQSSYPELAANAALVLIGVATALLDRQLASQAAAFEKEGGFTERLYRVRSAAKKGKP